ncbi:uncharacterized protein LOC123195698 [Mangifera indica]|uniref:uncharacterized protein LOC123195698 n=1 Tax=Mangifera indica TaxID=29780 RepID=UPI001CFC2E28|nr:uncharacterized protein LOC123195698 [Mangifera indica]
MRILDRQSSSWTSSPSLSRDASSGPLDFTSLVVALPHIEASVQPSVIDPTCTIEPTLVDAPITIDVDDNRSPHEISSLTSSVMLQDDKLVNITCLGDDAVQLPTQGEIVQNFDIYVLHCCLQGVSYGLDFSSDKEIALKRIAIEYLCDCFLLDASVDGAGNELNQAWGNNGGSILYVVSDNKDAFHKLRSRWLIIVMGATSTSVSDISSMLYINKPEELPMTICQLNKKAQRRQYRR